MRTARIHLRYVSESRPLCRQHHEVVTLTTDPQRATCKRCRALHAALPRRVRVTHIDAGHRGNEVLCHHLRRSNDALTRTEPVKLSTHSPTCRVCLRLLMRYPQLHARARHAQLEAGRQKIAEITYAAVGALGVAS